MDILNHFSLVTLLSFTDLISNAGTFCSPVGQSKYLGSNMSWNITLANEQLETLLTIDSMDTK